MASLGFAADLRLTGDPKAAGLGMEGVEPPTLWFVAIDSNPLSYIPDCQAFNSLGVRIPALASAWLSPKGRQRALNSSPSAKGNQWEIWKPR